jgi:hypothetical protein
MKMRTSVIRGWMQSVTMMTGLLLIVAGAETGLAAVNAWKNPVSGSWGTAGNWSAGLPQSAQDASIAVAGAYTVTVDNFTADNALGLVVTNITVGAASGLPALAVNFTNTTRTLTVGAANDGKLGVGTTSGSHGRLVIANGKISAARLYAGDVGSASSGAILISGGTLHLRSTHATLNWLRLGAAAGCTGTLVMTGGELVTTNGASYGCVGYSGKGLFILSNGVVRTAGILVGGNTGGEGGMQLFGGEFIQRKEASEIGSGANAIGTVLVDGGKWIATNTAVGTINIGVRSGSRGVMTVSNGIVRMTASLGTRAGAYGEWNAAGGTSVVSLLKIGTYTGTSGSGQGVVNVSGGYLNVPSGYAELANGGPARGTLNVSGGLCEVGGFGVIMGNGDGAWSEINVAGGEFRMTAGVVYLRSGAISVSGGSFQTGTLLLGTTGGTGSAKTGTVSIAGGTVTLGTTTVGESGRPGFLRVAGSAPSSITVNALTATTADSTFQFALDAAGVTPITVNNALTVNANTKLTVDCGAYDKRNGLAVPLITYGTRIGAFTAANIAIINTGSATAGIDPGDGSADAVTLRITLPPGGTILQVR